MPHAVLLAYQHVIHLLGQVRVERRRPQARAEHVGPDAERLRGEPGILDPVQPALANLGEIEPRIVVAEEAAPGLGRARQDGGQAAVRRDAVQRRHAAGGVVGIALDHRDLGLRRVVARLRVRDHRRPDPAGDLVRRDPPLQHRAGAAPGQETAHHVPAVLRLGASVVERERAAQGLDLHPALRVLGSEHQRGAGRERQGLHAGRDARPDGAGRVARHRAGLDARQDAVPSVHDVRPAEVGGRQELQVESRPSHQISRQRGVEPHRDEQGGPVGPRLHTVGEREVGIGERDIDPVRHRVRVPCDHPGDRVPLLGRVGEPHVAVGRGAHSMVDQLDAAELGVVEQATVPVGEHQQVHAARLEVARVVERERRLLRRPGASQQEPQAHRQRQHPLHAASPPPRANARGGAPGPLKAGSQR